MMTSDIIDWNNWKKVLAKFSQVNFRKSYEILDQFVKSIKSYIKMFEVAGLLGHALSPDRVNTLWFSQNFCKSILKFSVN